MTSEISLTNTNKLSGRAIAGWLGAFIGFPIAGVAAQLAVGAVDNITDGLIGGAISGAVIGLAEWLVLRKTHAINPAWIAATTAGLGLGLGTAVTIVGAGNTPSEIVQRAVVTGVILSLAQGALLVKRLPLAIYWVLAVALTYPLSWFITSGVIGTSVENGFTVFGSSGAIVFQIITGAALLLAARNKAKAQ